jgi:lysyl endopeptidase
MCLKYTVLFVIILANCLLSYSQISFPGRPVEMSKNFQDHLQYIEVVRPQVIHDEPLSKDGFLNYKSSRFADNVEVFYSPDNSGDWDSSKADINIWRVGFYSPGASSMGIIFNKFQLQAGTKLFLYSPSKAELLGAFTFRNNNSNDLLAIVPLKDDSVVIEFQVQKRIHNFGKLEINQIGLGFSLHESNKSADDRWYGTSADCQVDVNCLIDQQVQVQKHAVCKIIYNNTSRCTGTLINNTRIDARPIVLTAAHCISSESSASSAVYLFDYESPYCDGPDVKGKSLSGSRLLATSDKLDFSLIELNDKVPVDYRPVYSGWDITTNPFSKTYTIHHPEGDVKKISINNDQILNGSYLDIEYQGFWLLRDYEIGSSEAGSSGSALFDSAFHIRGTLTFGGIVCEPVIDDYYSRFDRSWNYFPDSSKQLAYWLDPLNSTIEYIDRYIPSDPLLEYSEQLSNIKIGDSLIAQKYKNGWGYPSGINSNGTTEYAEYFYRNGSKYIYALKIGIAKVSTLSNHSKVIFKIWDGEQFPENLVYQKELLLFELTENDTNLIRFDTAIYVNKGFFVGYEIQTVDTFDTIAFLYADPQLKQSDNSAFARINNLWKPLSDGLNNFNTSLAIFPLVFDYYVDSKTVPGEFPYGDLTLYPNPAKDHLQILFKEKPKGEMFYKIYDLYGKEIICKSNTNIEPNYSIDISNLPQGLYLLKVFNSDRVFKKKFVKLN